MVKIDTAQNKVVGRPVPLGGTPSGMATGEGSVWVANTGDATLQRIDPDKQCARRRPAEASATIPSAVTVGDGSVWVTVAEDNTIVRVEP